MGFPPHKKGRQKFFDEVANNKYTVVFYESTHRILKTLKELSLRGAPSRILRDGAPKQSCGRQQSNGIAALTPFARNDAKQLVVCRELTKMFETIYRGNAEEILKILESDKNQQKGEFVVVVGK